MNGFFKPWRRKIGTVTLVMACLCLAAWFRTRAMEDKFHFQRAHRTDCPIHVFTSSDGCFGYYRYINLLFIETWRWDSEPVGNLPVLPSDVDNTKWKFNCGAFEFGELRKSGEVREHYILIPYLSMIVPLAALSAWLLLSRPTRKMVKS